MTLEDVHVVQSKTVQRATYGSEYSLISHVVSSQNKESQVQLASIYLSAQSAVIGHTCGTTSLGLAIRVVSLGQDDDALPWDIVLF